MQSSLADHSAHPSPVWRLRVASLMQERLTRRALVTWLMVGSFMAVSSVSVGSTRIDLAKAKRAVEDVVVRELADDPLKSFETVASTCWRVPAGQVRCRTGVNGMDVIGATTCVVRSQVRQTKSRRLRVAVRSSRCYRVD